MRVGGLARVLVAGVQVAHDAEARIGRELGWAPRETFESGLRKTVAWYLENRDWCERVSSGAYRERLGLGSKGGSAR